MQVDIYDADAGDPRKARAAILRQVVTDLTTAGAHRLVIVRASDQAVLYVAANGDP